MSVQDTLTGPAPDIAQRWREMLVDPSFQDLPFKVELSAAGKIEMTPLGSRGAQVQARVMVELSRRPDGVAHRGCGVQTSDGIRSPDASWISDARMEMLAAQGDPDPLPIAPDICVEVVSPLNTRTDMERKVQAYLEAGAQEVRLVTLDGVKDIRRR